MTNPNEEFGISAEQVRGLVRITTKDIYGSFRIAASAGYPDGANISPSHYYLRPELMSVAISDAATDIRRAAGYHSTTGPSDVRVASYVSWWIAHTRPIQLTKGWSVEEYYNNRVGQDVLSLNAAFAVYCVVGLLDEFKFPSKFLKHLRYTLNFRPRHDPEALAGMINAALNLPAAVTNN